MSKKPRLSFWQIWNMSFGFLSIQFGFALQNANVSRIFQTLGAEVDNLAILWIAAPVTGLIIQPIVGHYSDKTWTKLGRRRPYFLAGAILASLALFVMPNSPMLWVAAGMLWIMDASINISMEPFRAFVGDMLPHQQRTMGFAMQSFFIGLGAVVASALPYMLTNWFNISNIAEIEGQVPPSVKWAFYIGGAVFFLSVLVTILTTKEYSNEELREFEKADVEGEDNASQSTYNDPVDPPVANPLFAKSGTIFGVIGIVLLLITYFLKLEKELYIVGGLLTLFGILMFFSIYLKNRGQSTNVLVEVFSDLLRMPVTMKQLAVVQFFTWMGLFAMWIYTTAGVTSHILGTYDTNSVLYNEGADWVGVLFGIYSGVAALFAFLLPVLAKYTSRKFTHALCLLLGAAGLISLYFFSNIDHLWIPMIGIGIAWASILSLPYAILTGSLPSHKMGVYMGIFNFFIVIPQIIAATILGVLVKCQVSQGCL
ncbi:MAG: MFS transporter [Prolixibacteraceae bacterium]|nr:MFS transporter [Prolixibacteraceae bacterium]